MRSEMIRKHIGWYVKGMRGASYVKRTASKITQASELIELLRGLLNLKHKRETTRPNPLSKCTILL